MDTIAGYVQPTNSKATATYPDLIDLRNAQRLAIGEKLQNRQISRAKANAELASIDPQIVTQYNSRTDSNGIVDAQERVATAERDAANAANKSRYTSCTQYSNGASYYTY